jgi:acyl-CoA reductase-like NAD-dependent aldehyde dehydrogenase
VFADADIHRCVRGAVFAAMVAQGQSCVAAARVLVDRSIAREFADRVATMVAGLRVGDPLEETTQVGPVITPGAAARLTAYVQSARDGGAEVLAGGEAASALAAGCAPTASTSPPCSGVASRTRRSSRRRSSDRC